MVGGADHVALVLLLVGAGTVILLLGWMAIEASIDA